MGCGKVFLVFPPVVVHEWSDVVDWCTAVVVAMSVAQQGRASSSKSAYSLSALPRSATGFVGLKNLGCICYMNASVQNLFMVPAFRQGVLTYECEDEDKKESLTYQLQVMFANLQESEKMAFNPKGFCHALKVGHPVAHDH